MKNEYISRQAALDALGVTKNATKYGGDHSGYDTRMLYEIHDVLTGLPSADVAPVRHARWEHVKHKSVEHGEIVIDGETVRCSDCRHAEKGWNAGMNFCPNCGAKMDA